jgi:hypothetical protein
VVAGGLGADGGVHLRALDQTLTCLRDRDDLARSMQFSQRSHGYVLLNVAPQVKLRDW